MKMLDIAEAEIGYLEKKNSTDLDSKAGNVGDNNYTKYSRDLMNGVGKPFVQAVPWCAIFLMWCAYKAYGKEEGEKLVNGWSMSCTQIYNNFKAKKQLYTEPKVGDFIVFKKDQSLMKHIGIVYKVDKSYVYTIEGNTNGKANTVIENGGGVFKKSYKRSNTAIGGYLRPNYPQPIIIAKPTLNRKRKNDKAQVKILQQNLNTLGYKGKDGKPLAVDGSFGANTEAAVIGFQRGHGLDADGSYGPLTYGVMKELLTEGGSNG